MGVLVGHMCNQLLGPTLDQDALGKRPPVLVNDEG